MKPESDPRPAVVIFNRRLGLVARQVLALLYPLALLASCVYLFAAFGPSGWLWLVIILAVVLAIAAPKPPEDLS